MRDRLSTSPSLRGKEMGKFSDTERTDITLV